MGGGFYSAKVYTHTHARARAHTHTHTPPHWHPAGVPVVAWGGAPRSSYMLGGHLK